MLGSPEFTQALLDALADEHAKNIVLEDKVEEFAPRARYCDKDKAAATVAEVEAMGKPALLGSEYTVTADEMKTLKSLAKEGVIRDTLKAIALYAKTDKEAFKTSVQELLASQQTNEVKKQQKRYTACKKRHAELERLLNKIYEDNALGKLSDKRYDSLLQTYGQEQETLEKEMAGLQHTVERYESGSERTNNFIKLVERYTDFTEITVTMLNEFIEKIVVHERDLKGKLDSPQTVEIHLNFIGEYIPPTMEQKKVLTPEEQAEQEKFLERRERFRRAYEQRVQSGVQKKYYERTKYKKRAQYESDKVALLNEDYTLGANVLAGT